jgi:hypothetical protein
MCAQVGATAIQFAESTRHEFMEEYKAAHGLKEKKGPKIDGGYDVSAQPKREAPNIPMGGTPMARKDTGNFPERRTTTSAMAVGAWWSDPIFTAGATQADSPSRSPPAGAGLTTTSDIGSFWYDSALDETDENMATLRATNGAKRMLGPQSQTQFELDALPTKHRLL